MTAMTEPTTLDRPRAGTDPAAGRGGPSRPTRRALLGGGIGLLGLASAGSGWALQRYVIDHVEVADASAYEASVNGGTAAVSTGGSVSGTTYASDLVTIDVERTVVGSGSDQLVHFTADLQVADGTVLRSAFAHDEFGENIIEVPSIIASSVGAVWAVNGDYYGFRDTGIVIRNGVAYRDRGARQGLAYYRDGSMSLYDETATTAQKLVDDGVWQTLSFGPGLVDGGSVVDGIDSVEIDTNFGNHSV